MSQPPQNGSGFWNKRDVALGAAIGVLVLFGALIILLLANAKYTVEIAGTLDANTIWVTFLGIVLSMIGYLGIKAAMATVRNNNT